ncbi:hypothetical protein BLNAU_16799 [Blattamonas nauphoetae]|uniref:Uncharacterized protein n=1 Tax=Blattamonas nauphoetae TaxID=2049346 RepID=A0ABQ9X806_9EUKA|nr:hypothetical protein BLNAU_16799 [Blattamonas nauphoetae]
MLLSGGEQPTSDDLPRRTDPARFESDRVNRNKFSVPSVIQNDPPLLEEQWIKSIFECYLKYLDECCFTPTIAEVVQGFLIPAMMSKSDTHLAEAISDESAHDERQYGWKDPKRRKRDETSKKRGDCLKVRTKEE